jgi:hypothetical protein
MPIIQNFLLRPLKKLEYLGSSQIASTLTTYTFSSASFGTATADRRIIVSIAGANNSRTLSSVTVGGITATINISYTASGDNNRVAIVTAFVPTGTSGDIVVTWSGSQSATTIGWWKATGLTTNEAYATETNDIPSSPATMNIAGLNGGFYIGVAGTSGSTGGYVNTWGGAEERYDINTNRASSGADAVTTGGTNTYTLTTGYTGNGNRAWIGATF